MPSTFTDPGIRSFDWYVGMLDALPPTQYPALMRSLFFNGETPVVGDFVNWDTIGQFTAEGAEPNDPNASPHPVAPVLNQAKQVQLTYFSEEYPLPASLLNQRHPGMQPSDQNVGALTRAVDEIISRHARDLRDRVVTRLQAAGWGLAVDGTYAYSGKNYQMALDSGRNANLDVTSGTAWDSTGGGSPYGDLQAMLDTVAQYGGVRPDAFIFGGTAWTYAMANEVFREALTPSQGGPSILYTAQAGGQITPNTTQAGYTPTLLGRFMGVDCYICNELTSDGTTPYLAATKVLAVNKGAWGGPTYYGTIQNFKAFAGNQLLVPWYAYDVEDKYGKVRELVLETRRIWLPRNVNACGVLDTAG